MKKLNYPKRIMLLLILSTLLVIIFIHPLNAQTAGQGGELKWIRIGMLHNCFSEQGTEVEGAGVTEVPNTIFWPGAYGLDQNACRGKAIWLGCKNFHDENVGVDFAYKVVGVGPRVDSDREYQIFEDELSLIGKFDHPIVIVDNALATVNTIYDQLDEITDIPSDRMMVIKINTAMGVSMTKKVYAFSQQNHDDYFIYDYVFKNTGIISRDKKEYQQTIKDFVVLFNYRYALSGESKTGFSTGWGVWGSTWGRNTVNQVIFTDPDSPTTPIRAFYSWYGPYSERKVTDDWGCPNETEDGIMAAARYAGGITLHADQAPGNPTDDPNQPGTTMYLGSDAYIAQTPYSQFALDFMTQRYNFMTSGHPAKTHAEEVGDGYADLWGTDPGGYSQCRGFGPYQLEIGDSIRIVMAEGVYGLSREKNREVGANWLAWTKGTGAPTLIKPNGSGTTNYDEYKREWVQTCEDSVLKVLRLAQRNYESGFNIPQPPPPPSEFTVTSGGDRINLKWSNNAETDPHFDGYVIYRSEGTVLSPKTVYQKIFECNKSNAVNEFDDITAVRGFNYYYYIQSKDDGSQNDLEPGIPLYSSMFWTLTSVPAYLRRPAVTKAAKATPAVDTTYWELNVPKEEWAVTSVYNNREIVSYNGSNYLCIRENTIGTEPSAIDSRSWRLIKSRGEWNPAKTYVTADAILYNGDSYVCLYGISGGTWLDLVRVVPNPYDIRARMYQFGEDFQYDRITFYGLPPVCDVKVYTERGDLIWTKKHTNGSGDELWDSMTSSRQIVVSGIYILYVETPEGESVFRKFVVIR